MCNDLPVSGTTLVGTIFCVIAIGVGVAAIIVDDLTKWLDNDKVLATCGYEELSYESSSLGSVNFEDSCKDADDSSDVCHTHRTAQICYFTTITAAALTFFNCILLLVGLKRIGGVCGFLATAAGAFALATWLGAGLDVEDDFDSSHNPLCWSNKEYEDGNIEFGISLILTAVGIVCALVAAIVSCVGGARDDDDHYTMSPQYSGHTYNM